MYTVMDPVPNRPALIVPLVFIILLKRLYNKSHEQNFLKKSQKNISKKEKTIVFDL